MPMVGLALRLLGFRRTFRGLDRLARGGRGRLAPGLARVESRRLADLVVAANRRRSPWEAGCLVESLTLWWLLRRRGVDAELRIGVRRLLGPLESHAWVEYDGTPLNDSPDVAGVFEPFDLGVRSSRVRSS